MYSLLVALEIFSYE